MQGAQGDWLSGQSEFDYANSQMTDRSETSTENGSLDFHDRDDNNSLSDNLSPRYGYLNTHNNIIDSLNSTDDQIDGEGFYYGKYNVSGNNINNNNNINININNSNNNGNDELSPRGGNSINNTRLVSWSGEVVQDSTSPVTSFNDSANLLLNSGNNNGIGNGTGNNGMNENNLFMFGNRFSGPDTLVPNVEGTNSSISNNSQGDN